MESNSATTGTFSCQPLNTTVRTTTYLPDLPGAAQIIHVMIGLIAHAIATIFQSLGKRRTGRLIGHGSEATVGSHSVEATSHIADGPHLASKAKREHK
jgi:hypothetical protein